METEYDALIRIDENNRVIEIDSNEFINDTNEWIVADHGAGDRFHHAQGNYLEAPIYDDMFRLQWRWNGNSIERIPENERVVSIPSNVVDPIKEIENENTLLRAQVQALVERGDFVEDCLAEMAMLVYG